MPYSVEEIKYHAEHNTYIPHGDPNEIDCVLGFSFGYIDGKLGPLPGKSNQQLAEYIEEHFSSAPLILQFEINDALAKRAANLVIRESRQKGEYLNSREVALQALDFMKQNNWSRAAIVTHPAMEARNDALCAKLGMVTIAPPGLEVIDYDTQSAQPWTRDPESWWEREEKTIDFGAESNWI